MTTSFLSPQILGLVAALATALFVFELLRRGFLREKFAALWLIVSLGLLVLAVFPRLLIWASDSLGLEAPSNLLFFLAAVILLLVSMQLSYEVSRLEARTQRLAEDLAILRADLESDHDERRRDQ